MIKEFRTGDITADLVNVLRVLGVSEDWIERNRAVIEDGDFGDASRKANAARFSDKHDRAMPLSSHGGVRLAYAYAQIDRDLPPFAAEMADWTVHSVAPYGEYQVEKFERLLPVLRGYRFVYDADLEYGALVKLVMSNLPTELCIEAVEARISLVRIAGMSVDHGIRMLIEEYKEKHRMSLPIRKWMPPESFRNELRYERLRLRGTIV